MPIQIDEMQTQVDVQTPGAAHEPPRAEPLAEALPRWQDLARRDAELRERVCAWTFDD
jgi:hypothetical protein